LQFFLYFLAAENRFVSLYLLRHFVGRRLLLLCSVCLFRCASDLFFCYFVTGYLAPRGSRRRREKSVLEEINEKRLVHVRSPLPHRVTLSLAAAVGK
jgi:hypothetical protein